MSADKRLAMERRMLTRGIVRRPSCYLHDRIPVRDGDELELELHYREYGLQMSTWVRGRLETTHRGPRLVPDGQWEKWFVIRVTDVVRRPGLGERSRLTPARSVKNVAR
jgi:hypothetical protein